MKKKFIASVLAAVMVTGAVPAAALAEGAPEAAQESRKVVETQTAAAAEDKIQAFTDAVDAITVINYAEETKKLLDAADAAYGKLGNAETQDSTAAAAKMKLEALKEAYGSYGKQLESLRKAIAVIAAKVTVDAYDEAGVDGAEKDGSVTAAAKVWAESETFPQAGTEVESIPITSENLTEDLTEAQQKQFKEVDKTENPDFKAALDAIEALKEIADDAVEANKADIKEARSKYDALAAKSRIGNYGVLKQYEQKLAEAEGKNPAAIAAWVKLVNEKIAEDAVVEATAEAVKAAEAVYAALTEAKGTFTAPSQPSAEYTAAEGKLAAYKTALDNAKAAAPVVEQIKKLPETFTLAAGPEVKAADTAFQTLTAKQKELISNDLVKKISDLMIDFNDVDKADAAAAALELIEQLPAANEVTIAHGNAIRAARAFVTAYGLTAGDVPEIDSKLEPAETALETAEDTTVAQQADAIKALIAALPEQADVKTEHKAQIEAARAAYENASDAVKGKVTDLTKLTQAEAKLKELEKTEAAKQAVAKINALPKIEDLKASHADRIAEIRKLMDTHGLDKAALDQIEAGAFEYFEAAKAKVAAEQKGDQAAADKAVAQAVIDRIRDLPELKTDGTATDAEIKAAEEAVAAAKAAYETLTADQRAYVNNYDALETAEANIASAKFYGLIEQAKKVSYYDLDKLTDAQVTEILALAEALDAYTGVDAALGDRKVHFDSAVSAAEDYKADQSQVINDLIAAVKAVKDSDIASMTAANKEAVAGTVMDLYSKLGDAAKTEFETKPEYETFRKIQAKYNSFDLAKAEITVADATYTGKAIEPKVMVKDAMGNPVAEDQYETSYKNNTNAGEATVTVIAKAGSGYEGTQVKPFTIKAKALEGVKVSKLVNYLHRGIEQEQKKAPVIKDGNTILTEGTDYELSYKNHRDIGFATMIITGKGNYAGTETAKYKIVPNKLTMKSVTSPGKKLMKITVHANAADKEQAVKYQFVFREKGKTKWNAKYNTKPYITLGKSVKSGKTYEVKVRAYKGRGADNNFIPGAYTATKTIKVK